MHDDGGWVGSWLIKTTVQYVHQCRKQARLQIIIKKKDFAAFNQQADPLVNFEIDESNFLMQSQKGKHCLNFLVYFLNMNTRQVSDSKFISSP